MRRVVRRRINIFVLEIRLCCSLSTVCNVSNGVDWKWNRVYCIKYRADIVADISHHIVTFAVTKLSPWKKFCENTKHSQRKTDICSYCNVLIQLWFKVSFHSFYVLNVLNIISSSSRQNNLIYKIIFLQYYNIFNFSLFFFK